jgi:hypothetical protein
VTLDALKASRGMADFSFVDDDALQALRTASRAVDTICDRHFYLADASNDQTRYYTPLRPVVLEIDDCVALTSVQTDQDGDGVFETTLTLHTDFELLPINAALESRPWTHVELKQRSRTFFPVGEPRSVQVVGRFGWTTPPDQVITLTSILASRMLERVRTSALGIAGFGVDGAMRIAREDPDVMTLVRDLTRAPIFVG